MSKKIAQWYKYFVEKKNEPFVETFSRSYLRIYHLGKIHSLAKATFTLSKLAKILPKLILPILVLSSPEKSRVIFMRKLAWFEISGLLKAEAIEHQL